MILRPFSSPAASCMAMWLALMSLLTLSMAQTTLTVVDDNGNTVVIDEFTNFNGVPTQTSVISNIVSSTTGTSSTTSSSSTDDGGGGPIGYTTSTPGQVGPTTYVYTTTDQFGSKTLVTAVFTPTYEPTSPYPSVTSGTIIALSDFTSIYSQTSKGAAKRSITPIWGDMQMGIFVAGATVLGVIIGGLHVAA